MKTIFNLGFGKIKEYGLLFFKKPKDTLRSLGGNEKEWSDYLDKLKEDNLKVDLLVEDENERLNYKSLPLCRTVIRHQIDSNLIKLRVPFESNKVLNTLVMQFGIVSMFA